MYCNNWVKSFIKLTSFSIVRSRLFLHRENLFRLLTVDDHFYWKVEYQQIVVEDAHRQDSTSRFSFEQNRVKHRLQQISSRVIRSSSTIQRSTHFLLSILTRTDSARLNRFIGFLANNRSLRSSILRSTRKFTWHSIHWSRLLFDRMNASRSTWKIIFRTNIRSTYRSVGKKTSGMYRATSNVWLDRTMVQWYSVEVRSITDRTLNRFVSIGHPNRSSDIDIKHDLR